MDLSDKKRTDIVFDPNAAEFRRKLWVQARTPAGSRLIFIWPRIFKLLAVLMVAGWLAAAGAVWAFVNYQRGITEVRFVDIALFPVRRAEYRATLGRHYLTAGKQLLRKQNWNEALLSLRAAMAYAPASLETRLLLGEFYLMAKRPQLALQIMDGGAPYARGDAAYLQKLFRLCREQREPERTIKLAAQLLPTPPDTAAVHSLIAQEAAAAHHELRHFAEAAELIQRWRLDQTPEGQILLANISVARDQPEEAVQRLKLLLERDPRSESCALQLTRLYLKLGRLEEARRTALLRSISRPESPGGHIDLLNINWQLGRTDEFTHGVERFLADYASDPSALTLLGQIAAETAQPELARRVLDTARAKGHLSALFLFALMQAQCAAGQFGPALEAAGELDRESNFPVRADASLLALKTWAFYGTGNQPEGDAWLHRFLSHADFAVGDAIRLATALEKMGALKAATRIFTAAADKAPAAETALIALVEFHVRHNAWMEAGGRLPQLKALAQPPVALIQNVESNLTFLGAELH